MQKSSSRCAGADTPGAEAEALNREHHPLRELQQPDLFVYKGHLQGSVNNKLDNRGGDLRRHLQHGLPGERRGRTSLRIGKLCVHGRAGNVGAGRAGQVAT